MSDPIRTNTTISGLLGGDVTGTDVGDKRGLDVCIISGSSETGSQLAARIDDATASVIYIGKAEIATAASTAGWQIYRITVAGTEVIIEWADGDSSFDNIWDNRTSLTYS